MRRPRFVDKPVLTLGVILVLDTRIQATRQGIAISLLKFNGLNCLDARIKSEHDPCGGMAVKTSTTHARVCPQSEAAGAAASFPREIRQSRLTPKASP